MFNDEERKMLIDSQREWEMFLDHSYYDMYAVRRKGDKDFNSRSTFHFALKTEAERLLNYLNSVRIIENEK